MQLTRALPLLGGLTVAVAVACSDSSPVAPDVPRTTVGTTGQTDTGKSPPPTTNPGNPKPDSGKPTTPPKTSPPPKGPDTLGAKPSTEPRLVTGTVIGMGPPSDSANYQKLAGATVVWASADGTELARVTTSADGSFSLGSYKPASYMLTVTPPTSSPYKGIQWAFVVGDFSPAKVDLSVVLGRK
jgi:hypothetical protein